MQHEFATRVGIGFQNPSTQLSGVTGSVFEEVALGPMNLGLAGRETVGRAKAAPNKGAHQTMPTGPKTSQAAYVTAQHANKRSATDSIAICGLSAL